MASDATQGPWKVRAIGLEKYVVCIDAPPGKDAEALVNAQKLCAELNAKERVRDAAEELLAALKMMIACGGEGGRKSAHRPIDLYDKKTWNRAEAAIDKAEGRA